MDLDRELGARAVRDTLQKPDVHHKWERDYRTRENSRFYDRAFDYIARLLNPPPGSRLLDAGCGICDYSIRLAGRGFEVTAVDFSEAVLREAAENLERNGLTARIVLGREDLTKLTFEDDSFDFVLCWGVLMHIPNVDAAISELARVLRPGGVLVVSETNMRSLESTMLRLLRRVLGRTSGKVVRTEAGLEHWASSVAGDLMTRECDVRWLSGRFEEKGLTSKKRVAGQFSESYMRFSSPLVRRLIHAWNSIWFSFLRLPGPAVGNILIYQKSLPPR